MEGTKFSGLLKNVTDGGFEIETEVKVKGQTKETRNFPLITTRSNRPGKLYHLNNIKRVTTRWKTLI